MLKPILLACCFALVASSGSNAQSSSEDAETLSPIPSYPETSIRDVQGAWSDCEPAPPSPIKSDFTEIATKHALQRIRDVESIVNGGGMNKIVLHKYMKRWWDNSSETYSLLAKFIEVHLESTWRHYDKDPHPNLELVPELGDALRNLGSQIEECMSQVTPQTINPLSCLGDLLNRVQSDAVLGEGPEWKQVGPELALPFYEQWVADHAILFMVDVGIKWPLVAATCQSVNDSPDCVKAKQDVRTSVQSFAASLPRQIKTIWSAVQSIFPSPAPGWRLNESAPTIESRSCAGVLYDNGVQGAVCPSSEPGEEGRDTQQLECVYVSSSEIKRCRVATVQHMDLGNATDLCASVLGRIQSHQTDLYRYNAARGYYQIMKQFVKHLQGIQQRVHDTWVPVLPPDATANSNL